MESTSSSLPSTQQHQSSRKKTNLCQECRATEFCYQCPRCSFRSCSLACCRAHKERMDCNGRRDRTTFLRLAQMSDNTLTSDFHFLEDVIRNVDTGKRVLKHTRAGGSDNNNNHNKRQRRTTEQNDTKTASATPSHPLLHASRTQTLPLVPEVPAHHNTNWSHVSPRWRHVAKFALEQRSTKILFMPNGMQRRLQNTTQLKKDVLYWTVEWIFHPRTAAGTGSAAQEKTTTMTPTTVHVVTLPESTQLQKAMEHPQLPQRQRIMARNDSTTATSLGMVAGDNVKLLIKQKPLKTYAVLSPSATLRDVLTERTVIEFPTIEVVPVERLREFLIALQEVVVPEPPPETEEGEVQKSCDEPAGST